MFVNLVIFVAIFNCVFSRDSQDRQSFYAWPVTGSFNHGHQTQIVNFKYTLPNGLIMPQNPQIFNGVITGHTGFHGIRPINTVPPNWNSHGYQYQHQFVLPHNNIVYNYLNPIHTSLPNNVIPSQALPSPIPLQIPDNSGKINVESLNGKFEDFIRPDVSHPGHITTYGQLTQPDQGYSQGGALVHGTTRPEGTAPFNKNLQEGTTSRPITNAQVTTVAPAEHVQENDNNNGDVQYDIDIRKDTE